MNDKERCYVTRLLNHEFSNDYHAYSNNSISNNFGNLQTLCKTTVTTPINKRGGGRVMVAKPNAVAVYVVERLPFVGYVREEVRARSHAMERRRHAIQRRLGALHELPKYQPQNYLCKKLTKISKLTRRASTRAFRDMKEEIAVNDVEGTRGLKESEIATQVEAMENTTMSNNSNLSLQESNNVRDDTDDDGDDSCAGVDDGSASGSEKKRKKNEGNIWESSASSAFDNGHTCVGDGSESASNNNVVDGLGSLLTSNSKAVTGLVINPIDDVSLRNVTRPSSSSSSSSSSFSSANSSINKIVDHINNTSGGNSSSNGTTTPTRLNLAPRPAVPSLL
uniref:Uncharacterized protein n=1 Tax=Proboscia inermis TaxID=420281 RepID=A0A7S0C0S0_9STRA|mmetsp:Transcript_20416/g.20686  ORF Transcript_20416/g.20686 Transcript_20416/m.20686 type:complete len:336 (+) Transcript_20416:88-1095(+)